MPFLPTPSIGYFIKYFNQKSISIATGLTSIHCETPASFPLSLPGNRESKMSLQNLSKTSSSPMPSGTLNPEARRQHPSFMNGSGARMIALTNDFHRIKALTPTYAPSYSTPSLSVSIWELVGMIPPEGRPIHYQNM
jgi:hypothetical protein